MFVSNLGIYLLRFPHKHPEAKFTQQHIYLRSTDALAYNLNLAFSLVNQNHSGNKHFSFVNRNKTLCLLKKSLSKISLFEAMLSGVVDPGQSSETRRAVRAKKSNRRMSACFSQKKSMSEKPDRELSALK